MIHDLIGREIAGKYRIDSPIRETELGDFYCGSNGVTGSPVTIKVLAPAMAIDQRYVDRFLAQANAAAKITHPNTLNTIDIGNDAKGFPYAIYEAADGKTVAELLSDEGKIAEARAIAIAKQVAAALAAAHKEGVIHGGLNPNKVFVSSDDAPAVKVYDLGVRDHAKNTMTAVPFLAPEQCTAPPTSDERSDIYSLGVLLYTMVAGEAPFSGKTPAEVIKKRTDEPPPPLSAFTADLHPQLEPIILSAIAADPERRYQSITDLEEDLGRLADETGAAMPPVSGLAAAAAVGTRRNVWQTTAIVLAGILILGAALIYATRTRQTNPTTSLQADANSSPVQPINPATGAQEEAMLKLGDLGDASVVPNANLDQLPGGDGYNAWANGGVPPAGAPLAGSSVQNAIPQAGGPPVFVQPPGPTVTIPQNGQSQFMPNEGGVILVPVPKADNTVPKATPTPKSPNANASGKPITGTDPRSPQTTNPAGSKPVQKPAGKSTQNTNKKTAPGNPAEIE